MKSKFETAQSILRAGDLFVTFRTDVSGLYLPENLKGRGPVCLQYGYGLSIPIPDLFVGPFAVSGTLSFDRKPFWTRVPWECVYQLSNRDGSVSLIWPDDVPESIKKDRSHLSFVRGEAKIRTPRRGELRLVR